MKKTALTILTVLMLFALCACGSSTEPKQTPAPAQKTLSVTPAEAYNAISEKVEMPEMMQVPDALILDFYGINAADYTDAVFYICADSLKADEIVIVKAANESAAQTVETKLNTRLSQKAAEADGYSPEQFAVIKKCSVRRDGLTVAMIVSPDADQAIQIYESNLK